MSIISAQSDPLENFCFTCAISSKVGKWNFGSGLGENWFTNLKSAIRLHFSVVLGITNILQFDGSGDGRRKLSFISLSISAFVLNIRFSSERLEFFMLLCNYVM